MWLIIIWISLMLFILTFNYSAGKNNESYDTFLFQQECFNRYVNNKTLVIVKYVGDGRNEIKRNQCVLITIDTTDDKKIRVKLDNTYIFYDDFHHFNCDWKFQNENY